MPPSQVFNYSIWNWLLTVFVAFCLVKETTELEVHSEGPRRVVLNVMILQQKGFDQSMVSKTENLDKQLALLPVTFFR